MLKFETVRFDRINPLISEQLNNRVPQRRYNPAKNGRCGLENSSKERPMRRKPCSLPKFTLGKMSAGRGNAAR